MVDIAKTIVCLLRAGGQGVLPDPLAGTRPVSISPASAPRPSAGRRYSRIQPTTR